MQDPTSPAAPPTVPGPPHDQPTIHPLISWAIMVALGVGIWLCYGWFGLDQTNVKPWGWRLFSIFVPTVLGLMLRPLPGGAIVLLAVTLTIAVQAVPPPETPAEKERKSWVYEKALGGYMSDTVWLVLAAYFMSRALIKTGLARRIALNFIRLLGHNTLGLGYALVATDTLLAGMIPSNAARVGGIILPITRSLAELYRSFPGNTAAVLGTFLMLVIYQADVAACALFYTGQASNPLAADQAFKLTNGVVKLHYENWLLYACAPAAASLLLVPWLVYRMSRPQITHTPEAKAMAVRELEEMGPMRRGEWVMAAVFVGVCASWIVSGRLERPDLIALIALAGVGVLLLSGVLTWQDAVTERGAWDVFLWYGGLVQLGTLLHQAGVIKLFAASVAGGLGVREVMVLFVLMLLVYFYAHYAFASITAHILSMYPAFVAVLLAAGAPPWLTTCAFAYFGNLCAGLTHYGTTPAPIVFGAGYVSHATWWRVGFLISLVNVAIWLGIGLPWWKLCGLW